MKIRCAEGPPELGIRHLAWQGHSLCNKGFMKVFGIGKGRFRTLFRAAKAGKDACPFDNRYVVRGLQPMTPAAELIHGFLTKLYLEQAEHLLTGSTRTRDRVTQAIALTHQTCPGSTSDIFRQGAFQNTSPSAGPSIRAPR